MKAGETMGYLITLRGRKILLALVPILTISSHKLLEETSVFLSIHITSWFANSDMIDDAFEWGAEVTESVCTFDDTQLSGGSE
jgi:hypothetical protein